MELTGRIFLAVVAGLLASFLMYNAARAADLASAAEVANDASMFAKVRAEIQRRNEAREAAVRPAPREKTVAVAAACVIKPVMTDAEIAACRPENGKR
ncbi:MAG: hypothetical protein JO035_09770 [Betaproteobacteria bacterium]|nr:hypothetical protein [Betaproteobacteria bacterium]